MATDLDAQNLRVPGPTPLPPQVREALACQVMDHRGPEFHCLYEELQLGLQTALRTREPSLLVPGGGTAAMEAALVNLCAPGDHAAFSCSG